MTHVGFAGLDEMGEGMAIRLVRARLAVTVREMRIGPLQRLMKHGAATSASEDKSVTGLSNSRHNLDPWLLQRL